MFDYNWDGKLQGATFATFGGYGEISLKYDPMGNRVYKASSVAGNRRYIVDIASGLPVILMEIDDSNGSITNKYYYANAQILRQANSAGSYFYIHDRLGSIRLVINDAADVNNSYTYSPFGEMFASECNETVYNPFKFTGQWYDSEIGQYYLRARMYDPVLMRFTGRDPVRGKFQNPLTLHLYLYCQNDPINYIDRSGKMFEWLLESAIEAKLRLADIQFNMSIYNRSKCVIDAFSMMNLRRGAAYDLLIADFDKGLKNTFIDAGIAGIGLISPNTERIAKISKELYDDRKIIYDILKSQSYRKLFNYTEDKIQEMIYGAPLPD